MKIEMSLSIDLSSRALFSALNRKYVDGHPTVKNLELIKVISND